MSKIFQIEDEALFLLTENHRIPAGLIREVFPAAGPWHNDLPVPEDVPLGMVVLRRGDVADMAYYSPKALTEMVADGWWYAIVNPLPLPQGKSPEQKDIARGVDR